MASHLRHILDKQDWADIMPKLYAHALIRLKWFGIKSDTRLQGNTHKDFAHTAVTQVYEGTRVWNQAKHPDLLKYLKSVVNSLIANLMKSEGHKRTTEVDLTKEMNDALLFDYMLEQRLISQDLKEQIEETLLGEPNMWLVFTELAKGMGPQDIAEIYGIKIEKVRNLQKRIRRHIKNITNF